MSGKVSERAVGLRKAIIREARLVEMFYGKPGYLAESTQRIEALDAANTAMDDYIARLERIATAAQEQRSYLHAPHGRARIEDLSAELDVAIAALDADK